MNPWDGIPNASLTDDLPALVERARGLGSTGAVTAFVPAALASFLGVPPRGVAVALMSAATTESRVRATRVGDEWVLSGDAGAVPFGGEATTVLVPAMIDSDETLNLFVVDTALRGVARTPRTSLGTRSMARVELDDIRVAGARRYDDGTDDPWSTVVDALDKATVVAAAELTGVARAALSRAVAYASTREQFGAPIATYQAVAHRLVDIAIETEAAELAVEEAADAPTPDNASRAKIIANDAAQRATAGLHQVNGGVGFYADQPAPSLFARALALRVEMGDTRTHRLRLAERLAYPSSTT
jgi:alkylation response protein AidB-like acyl-CoA dehydrogenase